MTIIRKMIYENEPLTTEQINELEKLDKRPIVFDEDCPELTDEQLEQIFQMAAKQRAERKLNKHIYRELEISERNIEEGKVYKSEYAIGILKNKYKELNI